MGGKVYEQWGKVLDIVPHTLIKYTLFAPRPGLEDKPENYFVMSYILNQVGNSTQLSIEQDDNRPGVDGEDDAQASQGENSVLAILKDVAEGL